MGAVAGFRPPGGLQILDETVSLLRGAAGKLLPAYYIGSLPFVLGLLYFWTDMSHSADAHRYLGISSLGVAMLFVWMKCWQAVFALRIRNHALMNALAAGEKVDFPRRIAVQTILHATASIVLPAASVLVLPFGWCYAFYQNVSAVPPEHAASLRTVWRFAWQQARLWPRQNHVILAVMSLFSLVVVVNLAVAVFILPHLVKKFFGADIMFTMSGIHALNTTFWAVVLALAYLCVDPILKGAYALRCHYGESLKTGTDIKMELMQCVSQQPLPPVP
jgi:hypothetical protein